MTTKSILIIIILFHCFSGCGLIEDNTPYDYSIDQLLHCFCGSDGVVRIFVQNDSIQNVIRISDKIKVNADHWDRYRTIEGLNREIGKLDTNKYSLDVAYHPTEKYPIRVFINIKPVVADSFTLIIDDAGYGYETSNYLKLK